MRNYTIPSATYRGGGSGGFCRLVEATYSNIITDSETPLRLGLVFERTDYSPSCSGIVSTLETEKEIVITRRSDEVSCFKNQLGCFSGAFPFGTPFIDGWAESRVGRESNCRPYMEFVGMCDDNVSGCSVLSYRAATNSLDGLPKSLLSEYGNLKYSEIFTVYKRDLPRFVEDNKRDIASTADPILSYVSMMEEGNGSIRSFVRKMNAGRRKA